MDRTPYRLRFRVGLTVGPPLAGIAVGAAVWGDRAQPEFFAAATNVLAIGSVGLALSGRFFRLSIHQSRGVAGAYATVNVLTALVFTGIGLFFAFRALATGHTGEADLAFTAGSLATGITAFGVQALFGTPGLETDEAAP